MDEKARESEFYHETVGKARTMHERRSLQKYWDRYARAVARHRKGEEESAIKAGRPTPTQPKFSVPSGVGMSGPARLVEDVQDLADQDFPKLAARRDLKKKSSLKRASSLKR